MQTIHDKPHTEIKLKLPFLEAVCWQMNNVYALSPEQMLGCYERGWRYCDLFVGVGTEEQQFIKTLAQQFDSWLITEL